MTGVAVVPARASSDEAAVGARDPGARAPIGSVRWRERSCIEGRIRSIRVQPWHGTRTLECVVVDDTGGILLVFLGQKKVAGVELGRHLIASGMVGEHRGYLAILNPEYRLLDH